MALRPVVLSGPSGSGKSTLLDLLFKEFPNAFGFSVSHTTRKPRPNEENGIHYHFTTKAQMELEIKEGKFIEYAQFSGNLYGTSKMAVNDVLKSSRVCLLDIEEQGVRSIKQTDINPLYVFIGPPSLRVLEERLVSRGTETSESIKKRMTTAVSAIEYSQCPGVYDKVIINDDLQRAFDALRSFLLQHFLSPMQVAEEAAAHGKDANDDVHQDVGHESPMLPSNGYSSNVTKTCSITEISLSPLHVRSLYDEDSPAVVAIDSLDDGDVILKDFGKNDKLIITDKSSAVFSMDGEGEGGWVVCGRNSWCTVS